MTVHPPEYFTKIQSEARQRWDQLEADPVLAGPWHQLFRQVQSPRHVLSELLQNADDAKASWIRATISNNVFEFVHDGEDFDPDALQSLCQFGLSNKRHLHTIGFRGVGFKSVFSLGPQVTITTPTISFGFHKKRFTEPFWVDSASLSRGETVITVAIDDVPKAKALKAEFQHWVRSPIPLLFFNHIRKLEIQQDVIYKEVLGVGPIGNTEHIRLTSRKTIEVLVIHSEAEPFPATALEEVRDERGSTELDLPPAAVQIVLSNDIEHHLYTVLPTDVKPYLPFSFNGPFIQDPARKEIKHPATSPTNQWLLRRIGELGAAAMCAWLENADLSLHERARAYDFLPSLSTEGGGLNQACTEIVTEAFRKNIGKKPNILLAQDNTLSTKENTVAMPEAITKTWSPEQALTIFAPQKKKVLAQNVAGKSLESLKSWGFVDEVELKGIIEKLFTSNRSKPVCPVPIERLVHFWAYLQPVSSVDYPDVKKLLRELSIVPVAGKKELLPASQVMVLGATAWNVSEENKEFLLSLVNVVDPSWSGMMLNQEEGDSGRALELAREFFVKLNLHQRVGVEQVVAAAAKKIFSGQTIPREMGLKLAQVAAMSDVRIQDDFKFLCQDGRWRQVNADLLFQGNDDLEAILPPDVFQSKVISNHYEDGLSFEDKKKWSLWVKEFEKSKLLRFPMPVSTDTSFGRSHADISALCIERGGRAPSQFPLKSQNFRIVDYDWEESIWLEWQDMADDPEFLEDVLLAILNNWSDIWEKRTEAKINQEGHSYYRSLDHGQLRAAWLQKLRNLPCLPDRFGRCHIPVQLYRRTADTDALYNVEEFVHPDFDKPQYSKLLDLLGARNQPTGVEPLLARLKDLSKAKAPPITHLVDLYRAIDRVLLRMDVRETFKLKGIFNSSPLIYTDAHDWEKLVNVFRENPEDIPGVRLIHPEALNLAMWDRMEVPRRPTFEMALSWLKSKPLGEMLSKADRERAVQILRRAPRQVWDACHAWLDATGRWVKKEDLQWYTSSGQIVSILFSNFKRRTADVSILDGDSCEFFLDAGIVCLDHFIEHRLNDLNYAPATAKPPWLVKLADILLCLRRENGNELYETQQTLYESERNFAGRLKQVTWQPVRQLKIIPYVKGEQAGTPVNSKVILQDNYLYVQGSPPAHHRELVEELCRQCQRSEIRKIIADCVDRDPAWIDAYAEENLELVEVAPEDSNAEGVQGKETGAKGDVTPAQPTAIIDIPPQQPNDEEQNDQDNEDEECKQPQQIPKRDHPQKKGFESFLQSQGFTWSPQHEHFQADDGTFVRKADGPFHWLEYNASGERVKSYWIGHGAIEKGIEIQADIWNQVPDDHQTICIALIIDQKVNIYTLSQLKEMAKKEQIEVYPARFTIRVRMA